MAYTQSDISALRHPDILIYELVQHLDLKTMDCGYQFDCPFCANNKASFHIPLNGGHYSCKSCGARGDIFGFLIQHKRMSFSQAFDHIKNTYAADLAEGKD